MKYLNKIIILLVITVFCTQSIYSQNPMGIVNEGLVIESKILKKGVRYTVYLPADYNTSSRYYPIVYLLHGYTDNDMGWIQFGEANMLADDAISNREIPPMIIAMPDGGVSWYINNFDNSVQYEDFFFNEFIPLIESKYRVRAEKQYRGISGLSMGGYGSLVYSLKHPDMFSACATFSAAIYTEDEIMNMDEDWWNRANSILYGPNLKGEERLTEHLLSNNPIHIVKNSDIEKLKTVRYYIDCGDDDFLSVANSVFHITLRNLTLPHEYRVRDGRHSWSYWRSGLIDGLKFIGTSFHQE